MLTRYIVVIFISLSGCFAIDPAQNTPKLSAAQADGEGGDSVARELGQQTATIYERLTATGAFYQDKKFDELTSQIVSRLPLTMNGKRPVVRLIRSPSVNAFALSDGTICATSGLLAKLTHPDQVAFVLAHEAAHWSQQHALRRYRSTANTLLVAQVADTIVTPVASRFRLKSIAEGGIDWASVASFGLYSRELEREADAIGLTAIMQAGYEPHQALEVLKIFERLGATENAATGPSLLSDHPGTQERIDSLQKILDSTATNPLHESTSFDETFIQETADLRLMNATWTARNGDFFDALDDIELVERAIPKHKNSTAWSRVQFERGEIYRAMARDLGFVKSTISAEYWIELHGSAKDEDVRTKWCEEGRRNLEGVVTPKSLAEAAHKDRMSMKCEGGV